MSRASSQSTPLYSAEDLFGFGDSFRGELVDGRLVEMSPTSGRHGRIEARITTILTIWCDAHAPDQCVVAGETGFVLRRNPDVVRAPDVAVLPRDRVGDAPGEFVEGAPDVAVEVLSPSNTVSEMERKLRDYFDGGARSVWWVDAESRTAVVYRSLREREVFASRDSLVDPALPGLRVLVEDLFR
jgi:Uma2 family endonuclease